MNPVSRHRRKRKIRRTGRHTTPSQAEKVAQKAGKAAPALAVVGALAAGPQVHKPAPARPAATAGKAIDVHLDAAVFPAHHTGHKHGRSYTVRPGDTLSGIAWRFYGKAGDWPWLYHINKSKISDPNLIYVGQVLSVPQDPPASFTVGAAASHPVASHPVAAHSVHPHSHGAPGAHMTAARTDGDGDHDGDSGDQAVYAPRHARHARHARHGVHGGAGQPVSGLHGTLGCGGLEALWRSAGGAAWAERTAASIAMAESGGDQYATGSVGERGYWQINPVNGSLSTYDAYGNARAAVIMSNDGTNWSPWTTYTSGAYLGRC